MSIEATIQNMTILAPQKMAITQVPIDMTFKQTTEIAKLTSSSPEMP